MGQPQPGSGDRGCQCLNHKLCLCLESASACSSPALEQWPPLLPPALGDTQCSVQRDPFTPDPGRGYSSSLPTAPSTSLHPKSAPDRLPTCQGGLLEQLQMMHPQSSGWRALQPRSSSQPSPASSGAPGEGFVFQNPSGGWGHEKGFVQPAHGSGAAWGQQERTESWGGGGGRGGFGLLGAALGVSGSNNMFGFSCCSPFITAATVSKSKSKGELWLHPYLWQSHLLSLTPPWAAWHRVQLKDSP